MNVGVHHRDLISGAVDAVERYGMLVDLHETDHGHDAAAVTIDYRGLQATFRLDVRPAVTNTLIAQRAGTSSVREVLIVPYVTFAHARLCRELDVQYIDGSGNMFLDFGQGFVEVSGQRRRNLTLKQEGGGRTAVRAFQPSGLRVVFALLCDAHIANEPYRDIAAHSNSSLGTVSWVMAELIQDGYVEAEGRQRRLHRADELRDRWTEAYGSVLYPKLGLGRFDSDHPEEWMRGRVELDSSTAQWGGETAAAMWGDALRPSTAVVYVDELSAQMIGRHRLRRNDLTGVITFRQRFWGADLAGDVAVPPVLVRADMIASGDPRQVEAAARLKALEPHGG